MHSYRITYLRKDGSYGRFFVAETCPDFALLRFRLHTNYPRESVTSVEVQSGKRWIRVT